MRYQRDRGFAERVLETRVMEILVIDDEAMVRESLVTYLREGGYRVRSAGTGEEGLWLLEERRADLIFTDIKMPGLSGIDVLRRVRERWPATEVVLITGFATVDHAVEALRLGAYDFLLKPVRLARLDLVVRHCEERIRFSRDNRELREVVERLRELNLQKEKFIALANHEIRTPTTVAAGLVSLLTERTEELSPELYQLVIGADRAMRRLKEVVEDLGDLGLAQNERLQIHRSVQSAAEFSQDLEELCDMYRSLRNLTIKVDADPRSLPDLHFDRRKLLRAVGALVQNAVKFTPDGGEVVVRVRVEGAEFLVEVLDSGVGVPAGEASKIFEPFYEAADVRHHRTSAHEFGGGGLGVGLSLAQGIAKGHEGSLDYEPRPGGGSVFRLHVPLVAKA